MEELSGVKSLRETIRGIEKYLGVLEKTQASCCGSSLSQCYAIVEIGRAIELTLNELANILNVDKSTASRIVNTLVNEKLVERESGQGDRRYISIKLTEKGTKIFKEIEENMHLYFTNVYEAMPEGKQGQVIESLEILLEALKVNKCCKGAGNCD